MGSIVADFITGFVIDMLVEGTGHAILRVVAPRRRHGDTAAMLAGLAFWLLLALLTALLVWGLSIA